MYGYRDLQPCTDTETASILVLLGSRYPYKALTYVQREGSRYPYCMDKVCTLSESQKGVLVQTPRPQCIYHFGPILLLYNINLQDVLL